jgi:hypothetical protein
MADVGAGGVPEPVAAQAAGVRAGAQRVQAEEEGGMSDAFQDQGSARVCVGCGQRLTPHNRRPGGWCSMCESDEPTCPGCGELAASLAPSGMCPACEVRRRADLDQMQRQALATEARVLAAVASRNRRRA